MPRCAALLRAVNVGGTGKIAMADLRALAEELGLQRVQTVLQSGNLVFDAPARGSGDLETTLSAELERRHGVRSEVMVRTAKDWDAVVAANPFPDETVRDPGRVIVLFLKAAAGATAVAALQAAIKGRETVRGSGRAVYAYYPDGSGTSKLTVPVIEKALGTRATGRNWNTVQKIAALLRA
jgi:uncharacterized protein (DUF1697 family)